MFDIIRKIRWRVSKMKKMRRYVTGVGALAMAAVVAWASPICAQAGWWEENSESSQKNDIETKSGNPIDTTIQTNYNAFGATGFAIRTPSSTIDSLLGITEEMKNTEGRGIAYIANTSVGDQAAAVMQAEADKVGGTILCYFDIQLFKYYNNWNEQVTSLSAPIRMTIGILSSDRANGYDYGMIRLHDGKAALLTDQDTDDYTITFDSDSFSTYAMVRYPKGTKAADNSGKTTDTAKNNENTKTAAGTASDSSSKNADSADEWDEVPKTGDDLYRTAEGTLVAGAMTVLAGAVILGRKKDV